MTGEREHKVQGNVCGDSNEGDGAIQQPPKSADASSHTQSRASRPPLRRVLRGFSACWYITEPLSQLEYVAYL